MRGRRGLTNGVSVPRSGGASGPMLAVLIVVLVAIPVTAERPAPDAAAISQELDGAELLLRLGVMEKGAGQSFQDASDLLAGTREQLASAELTAEDRQRLEREIAAIDENLDLLVELYEDRFFGVFPLVRLTIPSLLADEGFALTEQLFHSPNEAAVRAATKALLSQIDMFFHPHVVIRSASKDRRLESLAFENLLRDGRTTPHTRRDVIGALSETELGSFDNGDFDPEIVDQLRIAFGAADLLVLTFGAPVEFDDVFAIPLRADYYIPGETIQGAPVDAALEIVTESARYLGFARDSRGQALPILAIQLLLLVIAAIWATRIQWSLVRTLSMLSRLTIGVALFAAGRIITIATVFLLHRVIPDPSAMVTASWWWPASLGLMVVAGAGLVVWIGQARLTDIVPGARAAPAVGTIFALVAMGSSSYFIAPLLLFDFSQGLASLVALIIASVSLAYLFGLAVRTGPPVPHYFAIGPLILAAMLGVSLAMVSPALLWVSVVASGVLGLAAWFRHRWAVAHGTEEPEIDPETAAEADQKRLSKLEKGLTRKS